MRACEPKADGALSVGQPGTGLIAGKWREIPDKASLERILNELPRKPFLVGEDGVSMSLAGEQTKLAIALDGDTLYIPIDGAPSTHIIKPDGERLPGAVQNEAFCLTLARMIGISTPTVTRPGRQANVATCWLSAMTAVMTARGGGGCIRRTSVKPWADRLLPSARTTIEA
ncbi:hypothetical protein A5906_04945 [Bradyrhizobium sacchari]|uniref:HipA-like protein n=1 Tax=Bradyrhizobium sacchari TaxID=1399419 RepID=A0A560J6P6_9BRAD|nr:HipA domain-containing protein [Bradyrhizobium sacchari]OPY96069.1 hypothetical protein A5906_04945 [Bradyrhizobium sacchari]TWB47608.1 HipA-like protein [Bradyrhizobium sacchari]TWB66139.1 HipA-like protein [Bradyrhizobium sacchari]